MFKDCSKPSKSRTRILHCRTRWSGPFIWL